MYAYSMCLDLKEYQPPPIDLPSLFDVFQSYGSSAPGLDGIFPEDLANKFKVYVTCK